MDEPDGNVYSSHTHYGLLRLVWYGFILIKLKIRYVSILQSWVVKRNIVLSLRFLARFVLWPNSSSFVSYFHKMCIIHDHPLWMAGVVDPPSYPSKSKNYLINNANPLQGGEPAVAQLTLQQYICFKTLSKSPFPLQELFSGTRNHLRNFLSLRFHQW